MRSSLVVEPMEVLYEMVPYDDRLPSAAAGEEAPQISQLARGRHARVEEMASSWRWWTLSNSNGTD